MSDAASFLGDFHRHYVGATSLCFAEAADEAGRSSYQQLVSRIGAASTVLDLACGDGYLLEQIAERDCPPGTLLGVDMSLHELAAARARLGGRADLRLGLAQALPIASRSVEVVTCHLALMLMTEQSRVVAELERVLRPGGRVLAVIPDTEAAPPSFIAQLGAQIAREREDADVGPQIGEPDWTPVQLVDALDRFTVTTTPFTVTRRIPEVEVWPFLERVWYGLYALSEATKTRVRGWVERTLPAHLRDGYLVWPFGFLCLEAWLPELPPRPSQLRVARPTDQLERLVTLYTEGLGFARLGGFSDAGGFDGVMLGHPGGPYHLEFTTKRGHPAPRAPSEDTLLVFYYPDQLAFEARCQAMEQAGFTVVAAFNPYWDERGKTFADPDGYRVVIHNTDWPRHS